LILLIKMQLHVGLYTFKMYSVHLNGRGNLYSVHLNGSGNLTTVHGLSNAKNNTNTTNNVQEFWGLFDRASSS